MRPDFDLEPSWRELLAGELKAPYFLSLRRQIENEYATTAVYPPPDRIFTAFRLTPVDSVRVVLLGQDPYHEPGQAQGVAFHVPPETPVPPSLRNLTKELRNEYPDESGPHRTPNLLDWARQGVLLLNTTLTVRAGAPLSHRKLGWETFTDAVIRRLCEKKRNLVFLLWGAHAQKKGALVDGEANLVLKAAHPSPLSARRGFFGCNHFRLANEYLVAHGGNAIRW